MKVHFKFKATTNQRAQEKVFAALRGQGATGVRPLFPGDTHKQLARLYSAEVNDEAEQQRALALLKKSSAVEFAEPEVTRRLIR